MARDASPYIRQAVVARLKRAAAGGSVIDPARIWGPKAPPDAPYEKLQYGQPVTTPFLAGCIDGSTTTFAVHSFAETTGEGDDTVGGEDRAHRLAAWAVSALYDASLDLAADSDCPFPGTVHLEWTGTQVFADGLGTDAFHGIATFSATVVS